MNFWVFIQGFSRAQESQGLQVEAFRWFGILSGMEACSKVEPPWASWKWNFDEIWTNWSNMGQLFPFLNLEFRADWRFYCSNLIVTRRWHVMLRVQRRHDWLSLSGFDWENHSMLPPTSIDILALFSGNVLLDPNGTRTIYFGDVNCKRLIPLPVATFLTVIYTAKEYNYMQIPSPGTFPWRVVS